MEKGYGKSEIGSGKLSAAKSRTAGRDGKWEGKIIAGRKENQSSGDWLFSRRVVFCIEGACARQL